MRRPLARGRAFTLVEVLIALALILFLAGSLLSYLYSLLERRDRLVQAAAQQSAAAAVFEQLEHDLATTFAADTSGNAGVRGDATSLIIRCRGTNLLSRGMDLSDLQGCEVRLSGGTLAARRLGQSVGSFETVADGVERLQIRYFNGREWLDSFDSARTGELPVAIETALWFGDAAESSEEPVPEDAPRPPDRIRTMVVPDGPVAAWKAGAA